MSYIFNFNDAISYEEWFNNPRNLFIKTLESELLFSMLKPLRGKQILDIGCGTGRNLMQFIDQGLYATGIDPSPYMLDVAYKNVGNHADLHRGVAEHLPFDDNSFDYSCLITTLEFVENPEESLREAFRVTKEMVFIGVLNRYSLKGFQRRIKGVFTETVYNRAQFFSVWELKYMVKNILGNVPVSWGTVGHFSTGSGKIISTIEQLKFMRKCPFGAFAGLSVTLVPRFRTKPISITCNSRQKTENAI